MNEASDVIALAKAGLVMQLKEAVGPAFIMERQKEIWAMARERWAGLDSIKILGGVATAVVGGEEASPTGDDSSATGPAAVEVAKMAVVAFTIFNMEAGKRTGSEKKNILCSKTRNEMSCLIQLSKSVNPYLYVRTSNLYQFQGE